MIKRVVHDIKERSKDIGHPEEQAESKDEESEPVQGDKPEPQEDAATESAHPAELEDREQPQVLPESSDELTETKEGDEKPKEIQAPVKDTSLAANVSSHLANKSSPSQLHRIAAADSAVTSAKTQRMQRLAAAIDAEIKKMETALGIPSEHIRPPTLGDDSMISTWVLSKRDESCASACDRQRLVCEEDAMKKHIVEVGTEEAMAAVMHVLGETCASYSEDRKKASNAPAFEEGVCFLGSASAKIDCLAKPREGSNRACFCSVIPSQEESIPLPKGVLG
jgi:hypothetical protein